MSSGHVRLVYDPDYTVRAWSAVLTVVRPCSTSSVTVSVSGRVSARPAVSPVVSFGADQTVCAAAVKAERRRAEPKVRATYDLRYEGQAFELGWMRDNRLDISEEDYLRMVMKKTCWLATILPARVGALIATGDGIEFANTLPALSPNAGETMAETRTRVSCQTDCAATGLPNATRELSRLHISSSARSATPIERMQ